MYIGAAASPPETQSEKTVSCKQAPDLKKLSYSVGPERKRPTKERTTSKQANNQSEPFSTNFENLLVCTSYLARYNSKNFSCK
jgi:hypothetical protein